MHVEDAIFDDETDESSSEVLAASITSQTSETSEAHQVKAAPPTPIEVRVLEAFMAQHYVDIAVPPSIITSHAVSKALVKALTQQSGVKISVVWSM